MQACVWVVFNPRLQDFIKVNQQVYILNLVFLHLFPRLVVTGHAVNPQLETRVLYLGADSELLRYVVKLVAREFELRLDDSHEVKFLVRRRWEIAVFHELSLDVLGVESLGVPTDENVGFFHKFV